MSIAQTYTRQDTLRGSNGSGRSWWDVQKYDLSIEIDTQKRKVDGLVEIFFNISAIKKDSMQIDLQEGLSLDYVIAQNDDSIFYVREGNVYWLNVAKENWKVGDSRRIKLGYSGTPKIAKNAPWDGGFIWTKDSLGKPWMAVACQGLGASSWWPCKDYQGDEPDWQTNLTIEAGGWAAISNGRLTPCPSNDTDYLEDPVTGKLAMMVSGRPPSWQVKNPINTYSTTFYIGDYAHYHDTLQGEKGTLDLDFYPLKYNETRARKQWAVVKEMLRCYEYWLGPYPFYEDGYKLVEAPYLGMEHQSAIAYGNGYMNGYRGRDLSGTGIGLLFDYIIVHESGHEWFGNSITARDIADNWLHEGFTTYTETLFAQWITNRDSAFQYAAGEWSNMDNDYPVIGDYGVNDDKGSDKYYKGAAVIHMVRMMLNDDEKFRQLLRGLNKDYYHKIVTSAEVEAYISRFTGRDLKPFFDQYLRTKEEPVLEWYLDKGKLHYHWVNATPGFEAPFTLMVKDKSEIIMGKEDALSQRKFKRRHLDIEPCGWYNIREQLF